MILSLETIYKPSQALLDLPAEVRVGAFISTADADDLFMGADGQPQPLTPDGGYKRHSTSHGYWTVLRQQIAQVNGDPNRPIGLFSQVHFNERDTSYIRSSLNLGVTKVGRFDIRPTDQIGIAVGRVDVSPQFAKRQRLLNAISAHTNYDDLAFIPVQGREYSSEVLYGLQATKWLMIRPNLQYLRSPDGVDEGKNAVITGLKLQLRIREPPTKN